MNRERVNIVVVSSHADNRGDEAAQRGMIKGILRLIPKAECVVMTISPEGLDLPHNVSVKRTFSALDRRFPIFHLPFILCWIGLRKCGLRISFFNRLYSVFSRLEEIADSDVVISCPGGPYIGELYRSHELTEHLFLLWIALCFRKPVFVYGPSMGPFTDQCRNRIRRWLLNRTKVITLRDPISAKHLEQLELDKPIIRVTADSAFQYDINISQEEIHKLMISQNIIPESSSEFHSPLIGFTPTGARWNFKNMSNARQRQDRYICLMAKVLDYLALTYQCKIVLFPQLYGNSTDMPLINAIIQKTHCRESIRVISNILDSDKQQAIISQMDLMIGNRYHSVVFALKHLVPTVCIAYEHKSEGVMYEAGLAEYLIDIKNISYEILINKIERAMENLSNIRESMKPKVEKLRRRSFENSLLVSILLDSQNNQDLKLENIDKVLSEY
jgi:colanic acid/amylovoran biosynthesis protein